MWELITAPQNSIFGIAIMLMLLLGILELASFMLGGINEWVDGFLPDSLTDTQAEIGLNYADSGLVIRFLSWLYVGKLPLLMLVVIFLAIFGLLGYSLQYALYQHLPEKFSRLSEFDLLRSYSNLIICIHLNTIYRDRFQKTTDYLNILLFSGFADRTQKNTHKKVR